VDDWTTLVRSPICTALSVRSTSTGSWGPRLVKRKVFVCRTVRAELPTIEDPTVERGVTFEYVGIVDGQEDPLRTAPPTLDSMNWPPLGDRIMFRKAGVFLPRTDKGAKPLDREEEELLHLAKQQCSWESGWEPHRRVSTLEGQKGATRSLLQVSTGTLVEPGQDLYAPCLRTYI